MLLLIRTITSLNLIYVALIIESDLCVRLRSTWCQRNGMACLASSGFVPFQMNIFNEQGLV
jgi:hypothetical protein